MNAMFKLLVTLILILLLASYAVISFSTDLSTPPGISDIYRRDVIHYAQDIWGLDAPTPLFAAQFHTESAWDYSARSPYANGLGQFTPSTAKWIAEIIPELRPHDVFNPAWSIKATIYYNRWLYERTKAIDNCNRWAFTLSAYNGGIGWIKKDQSLAQEHGDNPLRWWDSVECHSKRALWAWEENRDYPLRIISRQPLYKYWGGDLICEQFIGRDWIDIDPEQWCDDHLSKDEDR